jgi:hypothetical protein
MPRILLCCAGLALFALPCRAQQPTAAPETLVRFNVWPAPVPRPALKYRLLPDIREMRPGNPIQGYLKCSLEQYRFFFDKEALEGREKLLAVPLSELSGQESPEHGQSALAQVDQAARLDHPDWQILLKLKADGIATLLPDVQQMRSIARALAVRFRAEVAGGRFDDAIRTATTMFAMSRHMAGHPTLIGDLVGIAIANVALEPLEEMVQQRGCPNLYWALTFIPSPFVPFDKGRDGECAVVWTLFRGLESDAPMSALEIKKFIKPFDWLFNNGNTAEPNFRAYLDVRAKDEGKLNAARRRLVESGLPEERIRQFPADQVILLDEKQAFERRYDDIVKIIGFPAWQFESLAAEIKAPKEKGLFDEALIDPRPARRAQARLDRRIALLRVVQALRLYAAEHKGTLPAKLTEISVPLPLDPFTGKPFCYELTGDTAHLRGDPPRAEEKNPIFRVHYEISLLK